MLPCSPCVYMQGEHKMPKITIFTPTYNRGKELEVAYKSIIVQNCSNLEWVIMDDGSTDSTQELVLKWKDDKYITIKYYYQHNQGRFVAYNNAMQYFEGELVLLLDSDNYLLKDSISTILNTWDKINQDEISGIISYMVDGDNKIYGSVFPNGIDKERIYILYDKYGLNGDKCLVFKNKLLKKYKYPVFNGERFGGDSIVFNKMNDELPMYILREKILGHGFGVASITNNLKYYHLSSPNGMREHYLDALLHERYNKKNILKHYIGYIGYSLLTGIRLKRIICKSPNKYLSLILLPLGVLFYAKCLIDRKKVGVV